MSEPIVDYVIILILVLFTAVVFYLCRYFLTNAVRVLFEDARRQLFSVPSAPVHCHCSQCSLYFLRFTVHYCDGSFGLFNPGSHLIPCESGVILVVRFMPQRLHFHEGLGELSGPCGKECLADYSLALLSCCPVVKGPGSVRPSRGFPASGPSAGCGVGSHDGQFVKQGVVDSVNCGLQVGLSWSPSYIVSS